ncbi:hypothetical protein MMC26_004940 [Xylographa opegraphella]|nr:hypothetical protein [Xylographa opegraphella]
MSSNNYITPDIASILRSLAATTSHHPAPPLPIQPVRPNSPRASQLDGTIGHAQDLDLGLELEEGEYDPNDALLPIQGHERGPTVSSQTTVTSTLGDAISKTEISQSIPKPTTVDPRTIITYPAALRHITKIVARNEATISRLRKLISSQHQHERQWWDGRQALIKQQEEREEGRKKVEEVLKSMGGKVSTQVSGPTPAEDVAELVRYDKKVHRACLEMVNATRVELQSLGIPSFGIRRELVLRDDETDDEMNDQVSATDRKRKLRSGEVLELQKKVLVLLEDLCEE